MTAAGPVHTVSVPTISGVGVAAPPSLGTVPLAPSSITGTQVPFTWSGNPWSLTGLCIRNFVLMLLTLGIYGFWGRTEIRRRMWSSIRLLGEPLAYHGTPKELLRGFMTVLVVLLVPLFALGIVVVVFFGQASATFGLYQIGLFAVVYPVLTAVAFYRARRYRLSRTSWRGIRGSIEGSSGEYGLTSWVTTLGYPFTLGWIAPYRAVLLQRLIVNDTRLGGHQLQFIGSSGSLYWRYAILWFGTIFLYFVLFGGIAYVLGPSFQPQSQGWWASLSSQDVYSMIGIVVGTMVLWSIMSSFYYAGLYNYCAQATVFGAKGPGEAAPWRFDLDVKGRRIIWLFVTNLLITYLSLYILKPVATARSMKYYVENLKIVGPFEPAAITQNRAMIDQSGEGLGQAFDIDAF